MEDNRGALAKHFYRLTIDDEDELIEESSDCDSPDLIDDGGQCAEMKTEIEFNPCFVDERETRPSSGQSDCLSNNPSHAVYIDDPLATYICELFDDLQPLEVDDGQELMEMREAYNTRAGKMAHMWDSLTKLFKMRTAPRRLSNMADEHSMQHNGMLESDARSLSSLATVSSGEHSRKSSDPDSPFCPDDPTNEESSKEEEDLWALWSKLINEWDVNAKRRWAHIQEMSRRGIPHHFRGLAWQLLSGSSNWSSRSSFASLLEQKSACEKAIRRDITRTYPEHDFFKEKDGVGQEALFNVMKAYSIYDKEVGYCQGSAFVVGLLLMQMPEEDAFGVFVQLMQKYGMRELFKPSMAELGLCMYQLENLLQDHMPDLYVHFQSQSVYTNLFASSWFLTLFASTLSRHIACRVMDCFLVDGRDVIFRLALALLSMAKNQLLHEDLEGILKYFQHEMPLRFERDCEAIFSACYALKVNEKKVRRLEKEYFTLRTKEREDEIELRRLRTENRLLRQRVDDLELESNRLADQLLQGQVGRAQTEERAQTLHSELENLRKQDKEKSAKLDVATKRVRRLATMLDRTLNRKESREGEEKGHMEEESRQSNMIHVLQDALQASRRREAESERRRSSLVQIVRHLGDPEQLLHQHQELLSDD